METKNKDINGIKNSKFENSNMNIEDESKSGSVSDKENDDNTDSPNKNKLYMMKNGLAKQRRKRNRKAVNYNENSDSDDSQIHNGNSDSEDDDDELNPLLTGLSKEQKLEFNKNNETTQKNYKDSMMKFRIEKLNEIKNGFYCNLEITVNDEEASFIYDFCKKHQINCLEKIEDEGHFFLENIREMIEERKKQKINEKELKKQLKSKNKSKKKKNDDESEYEYDEDESEFSDDDDSTFSCDEIDSLNLISDGDDDPNDEDFIIGGYTRKRKRKRKKGNNTGGYQKKGVNMDGTERCGRLLLDDALKNADNFEGWSHARIEAYKNRKAAPNAYYYRFNAVGEQQKNGGFSEKNEIITYMERVMEKGTNNEWGIFSQAITGRVGYQCSNFWRELIKSKKIHDYNYMFYDKDSKRDIKFRKLPKNWKKGIKNAFKRYAFIVKKKIPGPFNVGDMHPKCPKNLKKLLKDLNIKEVESNNNNMDVDSDKDDDTKTDDNDNDNNDNNNNNDKNENKKSKKKKGKKSKNKKDKKDRKKNKRKKSDEDDSSIKVEESSVKDDESSEPPKKKRRKGKKKKNDKHDENDNNKIEIDCVLGKFIDVMTGMQIIKPAISPFGHVLGYDTWAKILRKKETKNTCPFTKQKITRRSLVKLDKDNIHEYKDKIVNVTSKDLN